MCLILHPKFNSQSTAMKTSRHISPWKKVHKWVGVTMTVFLLLFCVSGIILNHCKLFSSCSVSRSLLPASYHIRNCNNGIIKGTLPYGPGDSLLAYGNAGVWLTDRNFSRGLPQGADNRNIRNMVWTADGEFWCAAQSGLYRLDNGIWSEIVCHDKDRAASRFGIRQRECLAGQTEGAPLGPDFQPLAGLHIGRFPEGRC